MVEDPIRNNLLPFLQCTKAIEKAIDREIEQINVQLVQSPDF